MLTKPKILITDTDLFNHLALNTVTLFNPNSPYKKGFCNFTIEFDTKKF